VKNNPPVVYPGSIERVDFSEEKEDKGYVFLEIEKGKVKWDFCPLPVRPFCTIEVDISKADEPQVAILKAIAKQNIQDAVVRLIYKLRSDQLDLISLTALHEALQLAHSHSIRPELVSQLARPRVPELGVGRTVDPLEALKTYLDNQEHLQEIASDMLEAAQRLLEGDDENLSVIS
jgi:exonuclease SbcD